MNEMEALVQTDQRLFLGSTGGDCLAVRQNYRLRLPEIPPAVGTGKSLMKRSFASTWSRRTRLQVRPVK
ncbi:hypothetical protein [Levilactobacillus sp. HBUAS70063]|uniref:hypothetical protein n=1 Tax=Levilactobacillus sp. HBUAS70063 TaxID=3109359 RepID=UPI0031331E6E